MIRNAVIHLLSEQPVMADLLDDPKPGDVTLVCENLRTLDGKRPVFIDRSDSRFVIPYIHIRFIEIRKDLSVGPTAGSAGAAAPPPNDPGSDEGDLEIDEDFLRRIREA
ncbi:MAG TPA: hypothetical protein VFX65_07005 [Candidatus Limnocylindrales bacterium]|nr:hypothetical protein [Candidatus Limnocylindrales bacterium]